MDFKNLIDYNIFIKKENKEMTKKEYFKAIMAVEAVAANAEVMEFLKNEIDKLDNKKPSKAKTEKKTENDDIKTIILDVLSDGTLRTVSDIQKDSRLAEMSNQKLSALVKQLVDCGSVVRTVDKRKAYFSVPTPVDAETDENADTPVEVE